MYGIGVIQDILLGSDSQEQQSGSTCRRQMREHECESQGGAWRRSNMINQTWEHGARAIEVTQASNAKEQHKESCSAACHRNT